jgi:hypothetical protein
LKKRTGFISNSSSSSFIICAKENTLDEALNNNYEDIMGISLKDNSSYAISFLNSLKEEWISYLLHMSDNSTTFSYEEYNSFFEQSKSDYDIIEKVLDKISTKEEYKKVFEKDPPKNILELLKKGFNLFNLEIQSDGDGGNIIQQNTRFTLKEIDTVNIKIIKK